MQRWDSAPEGIVALLRLGEDVVWVSAPDQATLDTLTTALQSE